MSEEAAMAAGAEDGSMRWLLHKREQRRAEKKGRTSRPRSRSRGDDHPIDEQLPVESVGVHGKFPDDDLLLILSLSLSRT